MAIIKPTDLTAEDYRVLLNLTATTERLAYKDSVPNDIQTLLKTFLDDVWTYITQKKPNEL